MRKVAYVAFMAILAVGISAVATTDPSYVLEPWPYGAIAWVGERPEDAYERAEDLAAAVEAVFELWGLRAPDPMRGWEDPSQVESNWREGGALPQVLKKDPETDTLWRLTPLSWDGATVYPLLCIAFPTRILLAQGLGDVAWSGVYIEGRAAIPGSQVWFQALTGVPRCIVVPMQDAELVAWHELSHWMTSCLLEKKELSGWRIPDWIIEGIAEYTEASLTGVTGWKDYAAAWAAENRLKVELDPYETYRIGLAVVAYLVESWGTDGFIRSLERWSTDPANMIRDAEDGWRVWLGIDD